MRIHRFEAENFKRLKVVEIDPDNNTVVIAGRNAQGKSSVLDAIWATLAGKKGTKELSRPIRDGESKARVRLELDDLVVERKWSPSGSTVTVSPREGNARLNSPQKVLDELIGTLSFDPLEFAEAHWTKQTETLLDIIGREEFVRIADHRKAAYDQRTEVNRKVREYQAAVNERADATEVAPVDARELFAEFETSREVERCRVEWERIEEQITRLRNDQAHLAGKALSLAPDGKPRPSEDVKADLAAADETNRAAQRWIDLQAAREYLATAQGESDDLTAQIKALDDERADLIAKAPLPVPGLGFDDDGVTYNGVPFNQSSAAERLKVSVAMAMALNPELRVICIRDASLLDDESKQTLVDMAKAHDYQIWYEVVGTSSPVGVVIEDGEVQA